MRIAITTPTGHIGRKVTRMLLGSGAKLVLLARDRDRVQEYERVGAQIRVGSVDNEMFVTEATIGADALLWVTPPNMTCPDMRAFQIACGRAAAGAIRANRIPRVVNISSIGAQQAEGNGPINGLHDVERQLNAAAPNLVHLRPGFFFENFLMQIDAIHGASSVFMPTDGTRAIPMIATRDIAAVAAELLVYSDWTGLQVRGLHGPADMTIRQAVEIIAQGLERPIRYAKIPEEQARANMRAGGMSDRAVEAMLEMYRSFQEGRLTVAEARSPETTTPTTLAEFTREVIVPLVHEPLHSGL